VLSVVRGLIEQKRLSVNSLKGSLTRKRQPAKEAHPLGLRLDSARMVLSRGWLELGYTSLTVSAENSRRLAAAMD
jgi:hypothetical protein